MAKRNASATSRWLNCPGSIVLSEGIKSESSSYAVEGTQAHEVAEKAVLTGKCASDDEDMVAGAAMYLEHVNSIRDSAVVVIQESVEVKLRSREVDDLSGKIDYMLWYVDKDCNVVCHASDYKYGMGVAVSATNNTQLLSYFLLADEFMAGQFDKFVGSIVQPRSFDDAGIKVDEYTRGDVEAHRSQIVSQYGSTELKIGDHCRWCPANQTCVKLKEETLALAKLQVDDLPDAEDELLLELYQKSGAIKAYLDRIPQIMIERITQGHEFPGYKAIRRQGNRRWVASVEDVAEQLGVSADQISHRKPMTPSAVEKLIDGKIPASLITRDNLGTKIVKDTHRGPSIKEQFHDRIGIIDDPSR